MPRLVNQPGSDILARAARLRVSLGFVFGVLAVWLARPTLRSLVVGTTIACVGEALRIWAAGHINKSREVTSSGPYRWFAHPLYVGSSVMGLGFVAASNSLIVGGLIALYLGVTITIAVKAEERFLRTRFGDDYVHYRRGTRPTGDSSASRRFDPAQVMANREYRAVIGLVLVLTALLIKLL
jgi:protein-S-isoprenylcysteine O-methyltransferase Ste14